MVEKLNCIKPFKSKDKEVEITLSEKIPFGLYKCKLFIPKLTHKYDYEIVFNEDHMYPICAKDYNCIANSIKKLYPKQYKELIIDSSFSGEIINYSSAHIIDYSPI